MSAKWRAIQHRHRYTYSAVVFPEPYIHSLSQLPSEISSLRFFAELRLFASLNSVHSHVNRAKSLALSFAEVLLGGDEDSVSAASRLFLEILFLENSVPLHRTLVTGLSKAKDFRSVICRRFRELCDEYGGKGGNRFCVSRTALSVMSMPKLGFLIDVVEDCAVLVANDVVTSLNAVVSETKAWARPSPIVMEQCQEALSCLYYLFQRFPSKFADLGGDNGDSEVLGVGLTVVLSILKSSAFSRDCFVAAGVCFFAALQVCISLEDLGLIVIEGIFYQTVCNSDNNSLESEFGNAVARVPYRGDFCKEICSFAALSRLCLIRGILTAVPRTLLSHRFSVLSSSGVSVKTILYDGILPELCNYCENPTDSHFNFHALTVLQICLQQIKTLMSIEVSSESLDYDPIPEEMGTRVLKIIWNNLEDPLSQTVKQVHLIFDLFLDIQSSLHWSEGSEGMKLFLQQIASDLLHLGPRCKGRYIPLASLAKRLGARTILDMAPRLLFDTVYAYVDDDVCCAATSFLKCFLENLRDECWSSEGIESGYALYRGHCLPPILYGLGSGVSKLRSNLNTYALPVLLGIDVDSIFSMLAFISVVPIGDRERLLCDELSKVNMELRVEQKVAILISLLKVSRLLALIEGDIDWCRDSSLQQKEDGFNSNCIGQNALFCIKGINVKVLVEWLVLALTNVDESLRVDAAEFLFLNPKTSSLPSHLELTLLKEVVPLNMRSSSTAFQMKWASLFRKFFSRVRTALERQFKLGNLRPRDSQANSETQLINGSTEMEAKRAYDLFHFMRWLSCFLFFSCYPSAPYKRKIMAMDLIQVLLNVWSISLTAEEKSGTSSPESLVYPYNERITSPDSTLLLVGSVIDSWDKLRESSFRILLHFPTPLPGISDESMVQNMILWAKKLVCSPRVRESDAGALTFRLVFRKYVVELGWLVNPSANTVCLPHELRNGVNQSHNSSSPVVEYIRSLIDWLEATVEEGERDLSEACKDSFVHGVLLALRYTFEELDFNSDAVLSNISGMKHSLESLLGLVLRITSLALWVVSADAWHLPEDMDEMVDDDTFFLDVPDKADLPVSADDDEEKNSKLVRNSRTSEQVVMVGCWLAMKEVSLLLGTITRKIPLPTSNAESLDPEGSLSGAASSLYTTSGAMLEVKQLETIGNHFLEVLLKMKHNGAIDKTRAGFTALCNRLLCSNDPCLCQLTESWMEQLMGRTVAMGQTVDDLLRRSAGIPAAFIALFLSEPEGAPKKLLPRALRWLIDLAGKPFQEPVETDVSNGDQSRTNSDQNKCKGLLEMDVRGTVSKIRDEGVIPTVHAFNVLRTAFNDTNLATDTSGFAAEALILSICSFSSQYWEVRNSACLAYTALVRRMIGFLNVHKRDSARRALTGLEFLHRYPALHPFLLSELKIATEMLGKGSSGDPKSNLANVVHPSLCPMLILLSRLKPSTIASEAGDNLDPYLLTPFIRRCSTQSNLKVRLLASRALTGLISNEKLPTVLLNIASELPSVDTQVTVVSLDKAKGSYGISSNWIHGILLQLGSLVDTNCRNVADLSKKDQILSELTEILLKCSWIANPRRCPCPIVNTAFLKVLDHMLSISRTCNHSRNFYRIRNLLLELSTECLDIESSIGLSYYDPTISEIRRQAAVSYFSCVFQASEEVTEGSLQMFQLISPLDSNSLKNPETENPFAGLQEMLVRSLSDSAYEVRLATLKWLFKFLQSTELGTESWHNCEITTIRRWSSTNLQTTLFSLLDLEKDHRCSYYILRILFVWNSLQFGKVENMESSKTVFIGGLDCNSVFLIWDKFTSLYKTARNSKIRETLLRCLGVCIKSFAVLFVNSIVVDKQRKLIDRIEHEQGEILSQVYDRITVFTYLMKQHSASSEPVSIRKAAAESIIASGLLEHAELVGPMVSNGEFLTESSFFCSKPNEAVNLYARQILDMWFSCIKLLEDEDDEIRLRLAIDVQVCITRKTSVGSSHAGVVPTQVDKVIGLCFDHLSSIFGNWIEYFDYLLRSVLNAAENYEVPNGDLVRRVFDKEIDNHHEEKLLISQICCSHLEKLPLSKPQTVDLLDKQWLMKYIWEWRWRFSDQLMSFAKDHGEKQSGLNWLGGVGNHKDAFLPLYANLLGFYVLSNCILNEKVENGVDLLSDVAELGKSLDPYLRNPLILNLFLLVVKSHEKFFGRTIEHQIPGCKGEDSSIWDGFDPYFLLR